MKRVNFKGERIKKRQLDADVSDVGKKKSRSKAFTSGHEGALPTLKAFQVHCRSIIVIALFHLSI